MPFLSISEYKNIFETLIETNSFSDEELTNVLTKLIWDAPAAFMPLEVNSVIRTSINDPGEVFTNVSRCSYPPDRVNPCRQRCNKQGQSIFYAALPGESKSFDNGAPVSLIETTLEKCVKNSSIKRQYLTVSRWKINRQLRVFTLPFFKQSIDTNPSFASQHNFFNEYLKSLVKPEDYLYHKQQMEYLSELFSRRHAENKDMLYRITSTIFNILVYQKNSKNLSVDGLLYPSANTLGEGTNIALKPSLIDNGYLTCNLVMMWCMQRTPGIDKNITFVPASNEAILMKMEIYILIPSGRTAH